MGNDSIAKVLVANAEDLKRREAIKRIKRIQKRMKKPIALIARARAAWNKDGGGVLLTGEYTKSDHNGSHFRVLVDGGNVYDGKKHWIIARASGGGYALNDEAMAEAVSLVLGIPRGYKDSEVHYSAWNANWSKIAKENGWTLYSWENANTVVMIPNAEVSQKIIEEIRDWDEKHGI